MTMITREIYKAKVKVAKIKMVDGLPQTEKLDDIEITCTSKISLESAQKIVNKMFDEHVTVFGIEFESNRYQMDIDTFIKHSTIKENKKLGDE